VSDITFDIIAAEMQDLSISHERFIQLSHMLNSHISSHRTAFDPVYNFTTSIDTMCNEAPIYDLTGQMIWSKPEKKCECGAKFTSRPNYHSDYCPLYAEEKK
jgi:hypothetical protein